MIETVATHRGKSRRECRWCLRIREKAIQQTADRAWRDHRRFLQMFFTQNLRARGGRRWCHHRVVNKMVIWQTARIRDRRWCHRRINLNNIMVRVSVVVTSTNSIIYKCRVIVMIAGTIMVGRLNCIAKDHHHLVGRLNCIAKDHYQENRSTTGKKTNFFFSTCILLVSQCKSFSYKQTQCTMSRSSPPLFPPTCWPCSRMVFSYFRRPDDRWEDNGQQWDDNGQYVEPPFLPAHEDSPRVTTTIKTKQWKKSNSNPCFTPPLPHIHTHTNENIVGNIYNFPRFPTEKNMHYVYLRGLRRSLSLSLYNYYIIVSFFVAKSIFIIYYRAQLH